MTSEEFKNLEIGDWVSVALILFDCVSLLIVFRNS